jgi:hypothetical protein
MPERPPPAVSLARGAEVRPMADGDDAFLTGLRHLPDNAAIAGSLTAGEPGFIAAIRAEPWSTPMILLQDGESVAAALIAPADIQHLNGRLVVLARDPRRLVAPLALYLRHAFWSHPLHRLYTIVPRTATSHAELLRACGFLDEGRLLGHLRVGARMVDLDVFGLLRGDFDNWCRQNEPDWVL